MFERNQGREAIANLAVLMLFWALTSSGCGGSSHTCPSCTDVPTVKLQGQVGSAGISLRVDGRGVILPEAALSIEVPAELSVPAPSGVTGMAAAQAGGYSTSRPVFKLDSRMPPGVSTIAWQLSIMRVGSSGEMSLFYEMRGRGDPMEVSWDGRDDGGRIVRPGALYVAQLAVIGSAREAAAMSKRVPFAIAGSSAAPAPAAASNTPTGPGERGEHILRGKLFDEAGGDVSPSPALVDGLANLVKTADFSKDVEVEVHGDGTGSVLAMRINTQKRANVVKELLMRAGFAADKISSRGLGNTKTLAEPTSDINKANNRRIVIRLTTKSGGEAAPSEPPPPAAKPGTISLANLEERLAPTQAMIAIDGRSVPVQGGRFELERAPVDFSGFFLQLEGPAGHVSIYLAPRPEPFSNKDQ